MGSIAKKIFSAFSKNERLGFFTAVFFIIVSITALGANFVGTHTTIVPASGGSYTEGIVGQPSHPNPVLAATDADKSIVRLLFSNLTGLSEKISASENGKTWNIRLKENLRWSDGEKLTSDDAIFTIQKIQDPNTASPLAPSWQGIAAERVSELEFTVKLGSVYAFFQNNLDDLYILPKHLFSETPSTNWRLSRYNLEPVGSGPYKLGSFESRADGFITAYHLRKNPNYPGEPAHIDNFNIAFFSNVNQLLAAFNAGTVDGFGGLEPHDMVSVERPFEIHAFAMPSYYAVFFNQNQNLALQDPSVRAALEMAVDRPLLVQKILNGEGESRSGPVPPLFLGESTPSLSVSPDEAKALLERNGWKLEEGVRKKKIKGASVSLEFELIVPDIPFLTETAQSLRDEWQAIGANAKIITRPVTQVADDAIKNRNYQAILFGNVLNPAEDLFPFWHSLERFYPGLNLSIYNRKTVDQLIESIRRDLDAASRAKKLSDLEKMITNDTPAVFLYSPHYLYFTRKDLHGVTAGMIEASSERFLEAKNWYLKTTRVIK